jgi:GntR family transcriptional regulator, vanillate catabolism transcriptional regulator
LHAVERVLYAHFVPRETKASQTTKAKLGVRELVFEGELAPGERVPEIALAERLGISRTPLRIALETLAHEGLLQPVRSGGFVVRSFTRADIDDAIELRGVLEGTAARFAAERLESPAELAPLVAAAEGLDEVVVDLSPATIGRYAELNDDYHAALVKLAKSPTLARAIAHAVVLPFASPGALLPSQALLQGSREILLVAQHQHRVLIEAIRRGHSARAEALGREHARLAQLSLDHVLENHDALARLEGAPLLRGAA